MTKFIYRLFIIILCALSFLTAYSQRSTSYFDGPYIDLEEDSIKIKWVASGVPKDSAVHVSEAKLFNVPGLPKVDLSNLSFSVNQDYRYEDVSRYALISDLHGKYENLINLLVAHQVIDSLHQWSWKKRHLVINGDMFGRGDQVLEILWFLFHLEKEAEKAGGRLHITLGNHDVMVLENDTRFLHQKYLYTQGALHTRYFELFSEKSVLGNWIRNKKMIIQINDDLITHAGISSTVVNLGMSAAELNEYYRDSILPYLGTFEPLSPLGEVLTGNDGLFWYRGYKNSENYTAGYLDDVLGSFGAKRIIVGHTIVDKIQAFFDYRLIMVDCGMGAEKEGELLLYKDGKYQRGLKNGEKKKLKSKKYVYDPGIFDFLLDQYSENSLPELIIHTDVKRLIKRKHKQEKQDAKVQLIPSVKADTIELGANLWARGFMRKKVCHLPPVHLDFRKKELAQIGIEGSDRLRMVFVCKSGTLNQERLMTEYFIYKIYELIDSQSIRSFPVNVKLINTKKQIEYDFTGIIIEDKESFEKSRNAKLVPESSVIMSEGLHREKFMQMYFFQYMIANTDWTVANKHNLHIVKLPEHERVVAFPYDYDYSGLVNQGYATPHTSLPIKDVKERYFMTMRITEDEFDYGIQYYRDKKDEILNLLEDSNYLSNENKRNIRTFLLDFFKDLEKPNQLKSKVKFDFWSGYN
jgi:hypothetical protein